MLGYHRYPYRHKKLAPKATAGRKCSVWWLCTRCQLAWLQKSTCFPIVTNLLCAANLNIRTHWLCEKIQPPLETQNRFQASGWKKHVVEICAKHSRSFDISVLQYEEKLKTTCFIPLMFTFFQIGVSEPMFFCHIPMIEARLHLQAHPLACL